MSNLGVEGHLSDMALVGGLERELLFAFSSIRIQIQWIQKMEKVRS